MALTTDYHHKQATVLVQLAQTTRDQDTAKALMQMAAEQIRLAEDSVSIHARFPASGTSLTFRICKTSVGADAG